MIKSVSIQNFEAHEDTTVEFGEGMNSIVGLSNSGKSALIRAMMVVVDNEWSKEMVRTGYEFCRVKVETERGWVEAERGEKVNRWRCKEGDNDIQLFQKVGTSVPELATKILGMGKRDRGNGISELPNFQTQLEKHYMLAEVGDKKATSNMIAVMMDNAIGLGGMEDLIKDFSADLLKDRKWLNEKQAEIVDLKTGIVDEKVFQKHEREVAELGRISEEIDRIDSDISVADGYLKRHDDALAKSEDADRRLASIPDCSAMESVCEDIATLDGGLSVVERALGVENALAKASAVSDIDVDAIEACVGRMMSLDAMVAKCGRALECERGIGALKGAFLVDDGLLESTASEVGAMDGRIDVAESRLSDARDLWKRQSGAEKESKSLAKELEKVEAEFEKLKDELGVCPLCGARL